MYTVINTSVVEDYYRKLTQLAQGIRIESKLK